MITPDSRTPNNEVDDLVPIRSFTNEFEADIAKAALDAFGIENMLSRDDCGGQRPHMSLGAGIRLLVRSHDAERAEEALASGVEEAN